MRFLAVVSVLLLPISSVAAADVWTFGGEALLRAQASENLDPGGHDLSRIRPTATAKPTVGLVLLAQGQWYAGRTSVYQAYADLSRGGLQVRAGRQEIVLGSAFLLGADTFYDGASFDAVRARYGAGETVMLDVFAGRYVPDNSGGVDGTLYGASALWGNPEARALAVDLLYTSTGGVTTQTAALRAMLVRGPFRFEVEPCRQASAWGGHADLAATLGPVHVGGSYAWATPGFRHPDHDTGYSGDIGVLGDLSAVEIGGAEAQGLSSASLLADLPLGARTRVAVALHAFRAAQTTRGLDRDLGREFDLVFSHTLTSRVGLTAGAHRFDGVQGRILYGWAGVGLTF